MKKVIAVLVLAFGTLISVNAQDKMAKEKMMKENVQTISLEQVSGEFVQKGITVSEGEYIFEISNNNVGHNVGFVLVEKGKDISKAENHIKTAYVTAQVENNSKQTSNVTKLAKGEYVYFCPLNPTATDNTLTVK